MLTEVRLYGDLGKTYGESFMFNVKSVGEALKALDANFSGFKQDIKKYGEYNIFVDEEDIGHNELGNPTGTKSISIVPVVAGSKGFFKVILGVALIGLVAFTGGLGGAAAAGTGGLFGAAGTGVAASGTLGFAIGKGLVNIGFSLIMGGLSELLFKPPAPASYEAPENKPSFQFTGVVNTTGQGNAVPLGYGRMIVGSAVISSRIDSEDLPLEEDV